MDKKKINIWRHDINPNAINNNLGCVYVVTEIDTGMKYIGQKKFWKTIRRKPLKGKKRVRVCKVETDWQTYNTSSPILKEKIAKDPHNYYMEVLRFCKTKMEMNAYETYYILDYYVSGNWHMIYNEVINIRGRIK